MSKITKPILAIVAVVVIALIAINISNSNTEQPQPTLKEKEVIKIGMIGPLTGRGALFGNSLLGGMQLALKDMEKDTKYSYELIVEDDEMNASKTANAANKLITIDNVRAIISTTSGTGNVIAPIAQDAKVPHICVCSDPTVARTGNYNFNNLTFPKTDAKKWVSEARKRGYKNIASISMQHPGINAIVDTVKSELENDGKSFVFEERFSPDTTDMRTIFLKSQKTNPDIYLINAFPPALDSIGVTRKELDIKTPLSTIAAFPLSQQPQLFENLWFIDPKLPDNGFIEKFEAMFSNITFNSRTAPFGYDSLNILIDAFENNNHQTPVEYINSLDSYDGIMKLTKTPEGRFDSPAGIWIIKNGKPVPMR